MAVKVDKHVRDKVLALALVCVAMIVIHLFNMVSGGMLRAYGIEPRVISGLPGIAAAPWLHGDLAHLGNNLASLVVLGGLCLLGGVRYFLTVSGIIILVSGVLVWLLARDGVHAGASGWIFGLWSLAIVRAWYDRSYTSLAISLLVIFFYSGMVYGMLPTTGSTSFEGHAFGAVAGVVAAWLLHGRRPPPAPTEATIKFWE